jgi:hypothetical protein
MDNFRDSFQNKKKTFFQDVEHKVAVNIFSKNISELTLLKTEISDLLKEFTMAFQHFESFRRCYLWFFFKKNIVLI